MAKGMYIGQGGVARKVKKMYVGIDTENPIYSTEIQDVIINATNIAEYFTVTNGTYYFAGSGSVFTTNNGGKNSTTASTKLTAKQDISSLTFMYSYSSESNYDKFTLVVGTTTVENAVSGATTTKTYRGSLTAGQSITFTYTKDGSQSSYDDKCTFSAMSITTEVKTQTGTETKGIAHKIKKGYIGVGGVARPFFSSGGLPTYYGHVTNPSTARFNMSGVTMGDKAVFAGGVASSSYHGSTASNAIDVYDSTLTKTVKSLTTACHRMAGVGTKDGWALLAGGKTKADDSKTCSNYVYKLDESFVQTTAKNSLLYGVYDAGAGTIGGYALVAGGHTNTSSGQRPEVYAYDSALTCLQVSSLTANNSQVSGCSLDNMVIFAGGVTTTNVVAYNASLTQTVSSQTYYYRHPAAAPLGEKAIFAGGADSNNSYMSAVYVCDSSLTVTAAPQSLTKANAPAGIAFDGYVAFGYGYAGSSMSPWRCDIFDESMTMTHIDDGDSHSNHVQSASEIVSAAKAGNYAIFAGTFVSYTHALFQD